MIVTRAHIRVNKNNKGKVEFTVAKNHRQH